MKAIFFQNYWFIWQAPELISSVLKANNHECNLYIIKSYEEGLKIVEEEKPDIICFSITTGIHIWSIELSNIIKSKYNIPIIVGGSHATVQPSIIEERSIDYCCIGEGEYAMLDLMNKLEKGEDCSKIDNIWAKINGAIYKNKLRPLISDLDDLPLPDKSLYFKYNVFGKAKTKDFYIGRGCPYNCSYCTNSFFKDSYKGKGKWCRRKSVSYIINEIKTVQEQYGMKQIHFNDENFSMNKKWTEEFLIRYIDEINLPYISVVKLSNLNDTLVRLLKTSKCKGVIFGVETGSERVRKLLERSYNDEELMKSVSLLQKHKIPYSSYNMVGLPGETLDEVFKTVRLNSKLRVKFPWVTVFRPLPKTKLEKYCLENNYIQSTLDNKEDGQTFFEKSSLAQDHSLEFYNLSRLFSIAVRFPKSEKLIKKLISFKSNLIYELVFLVYAFARETVFMRKTLKSTIKTGYFNFFNYYANRKKVCS